MTGPLALTIGVLFATAVYAMLRGNVLRFAIGLILLTSAVNLLLFTSGGLVRANPPLIPPGAVTPPEPFAAPLPQAMILTAIVIGFGLVAFTLTLVYRTFRVTRETDPDRMDAPAARPGSTEP